MVAALVSMEYAFVPQHLKRLVQRKERLLLLKSLDGFRNEGKKKRKKEKRHVRGPTFTFHSGHGYEVSSFINHGSSPPLRHLHDAFVAFLKQVKIIK